MKITQNKISENDTHQSVYVVLSNGDEVQIYDNQEGYGSVTVTRHDNGVKSDVLTKTSRVKALGREKRFRNILTKDREIEIKSHRIPNTAVDNRRTRIELTHFYQR
jgi:hypothetical protein